VNRKMTVVAFSIFAAFFLSICLCYAEQGRDEGEFKAIVAEINSFFSKPEELMDKPSPIVSDKEMELVIRLKLFTIDYPVSVYADDAAYILTLFQISSPAKYLQESRAFLEKYPKASLEPFTIDNSQILNMPAKEIGVIDVVKMDISQTLYNLKRYAESAKEAKAVIDDLRGKRLNARGYYILGLNYYYLMKDYEAQADNEQVRRVCSEAIKRIPNAKDKESFVKKLKELNSVSK